MFLAARFAIHVMVIAVSSVYLKYEVTANPEPVDYSGLVLACWLSAFENLRSILVALQGDMRVVQMASLVLNSISLTSYANYMASLAVTSLQLVSSIPNCYVTAYGILGLLFFFAYFCVP
jgi:hypothetical protein